VIETVHALRITTERRRGSVTVAAGSLAAAWWRNISAEAIPLHPAVASATAASVRSHRASLRTSIAIKSWLRAAFVIDSQAARSDHSSLHAVLGVDGITLVRKLDECKTRRIFRDPNMRDCSEPLKLIAQIIA
jgi:hypothetical protein